MQLSSKPIKSQRLFLADLSTAFKTLENAKEEVPDDKRVWVIVRQATTEDNMARAALYARRETKYGAEAISGKIDSVSEVREENYERRKMYEVWWTLDDIGNLELEDGKSPFSKLPAKQLPLSEFEKVWGSFPTELSDAIWRACVAHNETWDPFARA
jgi:hypothetical protein